MVGSMMAKRGRIDCIDDADDARVADLAITKTEDFMRQMGCPVRISDAGIAIDGDELVAHLEQAKHTRLGESGDIHPDDVRKILRLAA